MHEGFRYYAGNEDVEAQDEPSDQLGNANQLREEREASEAQKNAERQAVEAEKKAERDARLAKQIADKAAKSMQDKSEGSSNSSAQGKEHPNKAIKEKTDLWDAFINVADTEAETGEGINNPVETVVMTNGSEISSELEKGEEMILELHHATDKPEKTMEIADEVSAQAEALLQARAALESVEAEDIGVSYENRDDNTEVFGETGPQEEVRDRLKHAWEHPVVEAPITSTAEGLEKGAPETPDELPPSLERTGKVANQPTDIELPGVAEQKKNRPQQLTQAEAPISTKKETKPISQVNSSIKNGMALVGGLFGNRTKNSVNEAEKTAISLNAETTQLQNEIQAIQNGPIQEQESQLEAQVIPPVFELPNSELSEASEISSAIAETIPESLPDLPPSEERLDSAATIQPVIPRWIKQIESDVANGRAPELKRWQLDVLRSQHPDILKKYEAINATTQEYIQQESKEFSQTADTLLDQPITVNPGELPAPAYNLPAYMKPSTESMNVSSSYAPLPTYQYASSGLRFMGTSINNLQIAIVVAGGLAFGMLLIVLFS